MPPKSQPDDPCRRSNDNSRPEQRLGRGRDRHSGEHDGKHSVQRERKCGSRTKAEKPDDLKARISRKPGANTIRTVKLTAIK